LLLHPPPSLPCYTPFLLWMDAHLLALRNFRNPITENFMSEEWQWLSFILFEIILGLEFWCLFWEYHVTSCFWGWYTQLSWLLFRADSGGDVHCLSCNTSRQQELLSMMISNGRVT
jgi:hypothetical protein